MVRTQVQLTEEQSRAVKSIAARRGVSVAEVIRESMEEAIRRQYVPEEELRRRANEAVGCGHSGLGDLSARHDDYAVEAYEDL